MAYTGTMNAIPEAVVRRQWSAMIAMIDDIQHYFMNELEGGIAAHREHPESWAFVGMDTARALDQLSFARSCLAADASPRLVDCGAGLGFIGMLARGLGFRPAGIELSTRYVEIANRILPWAQVAEGDVLEFPDYGGFEAVFYYGPFKDEALQERFELKVEADASPGTVIIANRKVSEAWRRSDRFRLLRDDGGGSCIFQKC